VTGNNGSIRINRQGVEISTVLECADTVVDGRGRDVCSLVARGWLAGEV
jgi:hypothetical protein